MPRILVVDDDAKFRKMISDILETRGYTVTGVENGEQAISTSDEEFFNLALIDINLPDMAGIDLLTKLRKTEPEIIKIIVTGHASLDNSIEAANKGVDGYVVKPFDPKKLIALIEEKLSKQTQVVQFDDRKVAQFMESRGSWMSTVSAPKKR
jgi:DNA-binding response OmpR family regulator